MSLNRPKRKATINKSYSDTLDESTFEESNPPNGKTSPTKGNQHSLKKKSVSSGSTGISRKASINESESSAKSSKEKEKPKDHSKLIPYNWQPIPTSSDYFSHKLNLDDAYISLSSQTLYCPNQPLIPTYLDLKNSSTKRRKSKDLFSLKKGDYIYMISEPSGEPYYIGRIMGFKTKSQNGAQSNAPEVIKPKVEPMKELNDYVDAVNYRFQIQWFYRPRDISKSTSDSRLLYASMHTDTCPLASFRGLVTVKHKLEVEEEFSPSQSQSPSTTSLSSSQSKNTKKSLTPPAALSAIEAYSQYPNCFYFDKLFDRYMIKFYDIITTSSLLAYVDNESNNSKNFLIALNKRFEYIFMESPRTKSFLNSFASSESCHCEKCGQWCASQESVTCASCHKFYHMLCLDPPLLKKPSRGFSWSCAPCNKKHDLEYQSRRTLMLSNDNKSSNERELSVELSGSSDPSPSQDSSKENDNDNINNDNNSEESKASDHSLPKYELIAIDFLKNDANVSFEERRIKEEWNMRYLGMHSRLEDGVDVEDRSPYPRASTRLGAKHQATNIPEFYDHPITYYDIEKSQPSTSSSSNTGAGYVKKRPYKKKKLNEDKDVVKLPIPEEYKDVSPKEFPQWLQPRPKGYIERGVDDGEGNTVSLLWKPSLSDEKDEFQILDAYIDICAPIAEKLNILPNSPNFMDAILYNYMINDGNAEKALAKSLTLTRKTLKEPTFSKEEIKKFEAGVKKYGSELYPTYKEVKSQSCSMIVRFYYLWKKTKKGRLIWGNYEGRIHKKLQNQAKDEALKIEKSNNAPVDLMVDPNDDTSYETNKILDSKKIFGCKHCHTNQSTQWFRITGYDISTPVGIANENDESKSALKGDVIGLCFRCARLWRRYAVIWEDPYEVQKKNTKSVGGWKKKVESELLKDAETILHKAEDNETGITYEVTDIVSSVIGSSKKKPSTSSVSTPSKSTPVKVPALKTAPPKAKRPYNKVSDTKKSATDTAKKEGTVEQATKKKKLNTTINTKDSAKVAKLKVPTTTSLPSTTKNTKSKKQEASKVKAAPKVKNGTKQIKIESEPIASDDSNTKRKRADSASLIDPQGINGNSNVQEKDVTISSPKASPGLTSNSNGSVKKQRKGGPESLSSTLINPVFNKNYVNEYPPVYSKIDKKTIPEMNQQNLKNIISGFKIKQLTDLNSQIQPYQIPAQAKLKLPFDTDERNCCICLDYDTSESSHNEMLICSNCGVNIHISCSGIKVPPMTPLPMKEWMCSACINDLNPNHSTIYSCCLCLANDVNHELAIFGSPLVKPDYLKPIHDSGKWCHLLCAIYNYKYITLKPINATFPLRKIVKAEQTNQKSIIESLHNSLAFESVSEIYLRNYTSKCGICKSINGSLIACDSCESTDSHSKYHITCAQDTANFKLGFKLIKSKTNARDNLNVVVGDKTGNLVPALLCPKHSSNEIYSMRKLGKRVSGASKDEEKPLIQLFIEILIKKYSSYGNTKLTGPQFKAHNYIYMIKLFAEEEAKKRTSYSRVMNDALNLRTSKDKTCERCSTSASPMWWMKQDQNSAQNDMIGGSYKLLCQTCYHKREEADVSDLENQRLLEILHESMNGENYGLSGEHDHLSDIYNPNLSKDPPATEPTRSRISIGDILS